MIRTTPDCAALNDEFIAGNIGLVPAHLLRSYSLTACARLVCHYCAFGQCNYWKLIFCKVVQWHFLGVVRSVITLSLVSDIMCLWFAPNTRRYIYVIWLIDWLIPGSFRIPWMISRLLLCIEIRSSHITKPNITSATNWLVYACNDISSTCNIFFNTFVCKQDPPLPNNTQQGIKDTGADLTSYLAGPRLHTFHGSLPPFSPSPPLPFRSPSLPPPSP